ncbi:MAG: hypothetical protein HZB68_04175 [Candidatus Aenigmarchaeota archaeon]|nr:hypothetical protein [Candidatus Aenigmarchaeota archaeon]
MVGGSKKRVLYHVPMVHSSNEMLDKVYKDANSDDERIYGIAGKMKSSIYWGIQDSVLKKYWSWIERDLDEELSSYQGVQIFCEAVFENGKAYEKSLKASKLDPDEWPTLLLCQKLVKNGANMEKTEKKSLYLDHAHRLENDLPDKLAMKKRDKEMAKRINENLDDVGIIFVGGAHNPMKYLDSDIKVKRIEPFNAKREIDDLQKRLDKKMKRKYSDLIDSLEDLGNELI